MLGHPPFYFGTSKKYIALFGAIFADIVIERQLANGAPITLEKVPLKWGEKEKILLRLKEDPNLDRKSAINLPVMSYELINMTPASERKLASINQVAGLITDDPNHLYTQYSPVPYDYQFGLYIYTKYVEDGFKILDQILPFFKPEFTVTAQMVPQLQLEKRDVPISLSSPPQLTDIYDGQYQQRQVVIWSLGFTVQGHIWGPVANTPLIKFVTTNMHIDMSNVVVQSLTVEPGLTANGEPTSNANNSIDPLLINIDDHWGVVEEFDE